LSAEQHPPFLAPHEVLVSVEQEEASFDFLSAFFAFFSAFFSFSWKYDALSPEFLTSDTL
jgi:hypothetical protein